MLAKENKGRRHHHRCLHQKTSIRSSPCGSFMFALGESYAGHFVCKWGGLRPPPTPPLFKGHGCLQKNKTTVRSSPASMLAKNKHQVVAVWIIHVLHLGKATRVILFANGGGLRPPQPPPLLKAVDARNCLIFIIFIVFRDLSRVFIIPCFCIILEPS